MQAQEGRKVALTGGTGFIGAHVLAALTAANYSVRALTRRPPPRGSQPAAASATEAPSVAWIRGDLEQPSALQALCEGCDAIIHCAGRVRGNSRDEFLQTNLHGVRRLAAAAQSCPSPPRFLFLSSLAARQPDCSWYAESKHLAERYLQTAGLRPPPTIFRPTAIYGPGDRELRPLFMCIKHGWLPLPGGVASRLSVLHVADLVAAIMLWLRHSDATEAAGVYELDDGTDNGFAWDDFARIGERVWRRKIRKLPVPVNLLRGLAWVNLRLARLFRYSAMLTPGKVNEIAHPDWVCDNRALTARLGWTPRVKLPQAMAAAAERR